MTPHRALAQPKPTFSRSLDIPATPNPPQPIRRSTTRRFGTHDQATPRQGMDTPTGVNRTANTGPPAKTGEANCYNRNGQAFWVVG